MYPEEGHKERTVCVDNWPGKEPGCSGLPSIQGSSRDKSIPLNQTKEPENVSSVLCIFFFVLLLNFLYYT